MRQYSKAPGGEGADARPARVSRHLQRSRDEHRFHGEAVTQVEHIIILTPRVESTLVFQLPCKYSLKVCYPFKAVGFKLTQPHRTPSPYVVEKAKERAKEDDIIYER